jgi:hypothetical protein
VLSPTPLPAAHPQSLGEVPLHSPSSLTIEARLTCSRNEPPSANCDFEMLRIFGNL